MGQYRSQISCREETKGRVTNLSNFGVFVELEEGIDGLIHISDLSWSKKINHPAEMCKVGDEMEVVVLEIDKDNRRLSLGHKQLEENPWDVFESVFTLGSVHKGTVISKTIKVLLLHYLMVLKDSVQCAMARKRMATSSILMIFWNLSFWSLIKSRERSFSLMLNCMKMNRE